MQTIKTNQINTMRTITIESSTIGETIDKLAEAFSGVADTNGLYILEMALKKAESHKDIHQRRRELDEIYAKLKA